MHEGNQGEKECPERNNGGKLSPSHIRFGAFRLSDTRLKSSADSARSTFLLPAMQGT